MANKPGEANFFPEVPEFPSMGIFQPVYGKFDLTTYIQGASDYEIMAFLVGKYNACLEAYGNITKLSTDIITACKQLQDWINSWFTNLDVQKEINKKLDSMVADGSFGTLLHKTFDTQINQQTTSAVTTWLVANVTPTGSAVIVDKSLSISGAAADAKATGERIGLIATINKNYFNQHNALSGYFYDGNIGDTIHTAPNENYACIIFPVIKGKTYVLARTDYRWNELDSNNKILSRHGDSNTKTQLSITPNTAEVKKVAISWQKHYVPIANYMILDSGVSFNTYIPYPKVVHMSSDLLNGAGVEAEATYTVGTNGDFDSFSGMLVALKGNTSKKTVYIETGIYDIFTEIGGQKYIESIDVDKGWLLANNIVPPNTKIIGVGDVVLRYKPTDSEIVDYKHGWLMSPLNIVDSCEIENISVEASNCRYAIHIESSGGGFDPNKANIKLKNVRAHRSVTTMMGDHQTVGTGIGFNAKWEFEECRFTSDGTAPIFSVHTNAPQTNSKASVLMKNCVFVTTHDNTHKLVDFMSAYLPVAISNIAIMANCFVGGKIGTETTFTNRQSFDMSVIGGASYGIEDSTTQTSGYTINNYGHSILS